MIEASQELDKQILEQNPKVNTLFGPISLRDFNATNVDIKHIAHSLGNLCRYNGSCVDYYSVAEHCVLLSRWYRKQALNWNQLYFCLALLIHDASEAYVGDMIAPLKGYCSWIKQIENKLDIEIFRSFGLEFTEELHKKIKIYDRMIRNDEMSRLIYPFKDLENKLGVSIKCWNPKRAKQEFINEYEILVRGLEEQKL